MAAVLTDDKKVARQSEAFSRTRPAVRPGSVPNITVVPHPRKTPGGVRSSVPVTGRLPMGQRGSKPTRLAKNLSVRSPMIAATLFASFAVSLLCVYVTAYARVNAEARHLQQLRMKLKVAERREIELRSEISRYHLSAPSRAQAMGLVSAPPESVQVLTDQESAVK